MSLPIPILALFLIPEGLEIPEVPEFLKVSEVS